MKIKDILKEEEPIKVISTLDDIEKTASLLDSLSEEDSLIDELAKLAVLKDFAPFFYNEAGKK